MSTLSPQTAASLDQLVAGCRAAEIGFRQAAANVDEELLHALLTNYAQMRTQLAAELERALPAAERAPARKKDRPSAESGQATSRIREGESTLADCLSHDEQCLKQYQWVLKRDLPHALRQIVSRQHAAIQANYQRLYQLLHSTDTDTSNANSGSRSPIEHGTY